MSRGVNGRPAGLALASAGLSMMEEADQGRHWARRCGPVAWTRVSDARDSLPYPGGVASTGGLVAGVRFPGTGTDVVKRDHESAAARQVLEVRRASTRYRIIP